MEGSRVQFLELKLCCTRILENVWWIGLDGFGRVEGGIDVDTLLGCHVVTSLARHVVAAFFVLVHGGPCMEFSSRAIPTAPASEHAPPPNQKVIAFFPLCHS